VIMDNIIFTPEVTEEPSSYPCLRQDVRSKLIVLFFNRNSGVVINADKPHPEGPYYSKGTYHHTWASANDTTEWIPVHGTVSFKL